MSNYAKRALQKLLVRKRHRLYKERIAGQTVPYGVWLEKMLEEEKQEILAWKEKAEESGERLSVAVFSWQEFCDAVAGKKAEKRTEDLWVVTPDESALADEAAAEVERYFLEHPACMIAYGDEDGYFKPGWSPELLQSFFYFGNVFAVRRELAVKVGAKMAAEGNGREHFEVHSEVVQKAVSSNAEYTIARAESVKEPGKKENEVVLRRMLYSIVLDCIDEAKEAGHIEKVLFLQGRREAADKCGEGAARESAADKCGEGAVRESAADKCGEGAGRESAADKSGEDVGRERAADKCGEGAGSGEAPDKYAASVRIWNEHCHDWGMEPAFDDIKKGHLYSDVEIPGEKEKQALVSVIIPSKDNPAVLSKCIHSLREMTNYENIEIIVIDNGSDDKNKNRILQIREQLKEEYSFCYLHRPMAFNFSGMCNLGAAQARGEYLLFLNDDMEIAEENWLRIMLSRAAKDAVGAVGAKLLYPDSDKIQHLGITNIHLGPAHKLQFSLDREAYYHGWNRHAVNVSAVTGACLLVKKAVFEEAGGFSEKLQVAFNDVEFCFHLLKNGYRNVCCNDTFLYHHESLSRGLDAGLEKVARLHRERDFLFQAYPEMWNRDDYYNRKLVTDILDRGFEPACRFEEKRMSKKAEVLRLEREPDAVWYNECLYMGVEFTGDARAWKTGISGGGGYYIQGWSYAVNVDNSRYEKSLLLKPLKQTEGKSGQESGMWKIPYVECYRPDLQENLPYIDHPELCGVSVWIGRDALPSGEYLIGYLWEDACSRQKLCGFSAETLLVR